MCNFLEYKTSCFKNYWNFWFRSCLVFSIANSGLQMAFKSGLKSKDTKHNWTETQSIFCCWCNFHTFCVILLNVNVIYPINKMLNVRVIWIPVPFDLVRCRWPFWRSIQKEMMYCQWMFLLQNGSQMFPSHWSNMYYFNYSESNNELWVLLCCGKWIYENCSKCK